MSGSRRFGLIAVAVALAAVGFVALRPEGEDEPAAPAERSPPVETTEAGQAEREPEEPREPSAEAIQIRVRDGEVAGGPAQVEAKKGEIVRLAVRSDAADHVHVHGYEIFRDVAAGETARIRFKADLEGIFEVELEESKLQIAELRVEP